MDDGDSVFNTSIGSLDKYDICSRHSKMRRRINGRYKGVLEISQDPTAVDYFTYRVNFLHRMIRDFPELPKVQKSTTYNLKPKFKANVELCKIHILLLKTMSLKEEYLTYPGMLQDVLKTFMCHTRQLEVEN
jgi:hypothetical protein